jgi:hypothetical protein
MEHIQLADTPYTLDVAFNYQFAGTGLQNCGDLGATYTLMGEKGELYDTKPFTTEEIVAAQNSTQQQVMKIDETANCW